MKTWLKVLGDYVICSLSGHRSKVGRERIRVRASRALGAMFTLVVRLHLANSFVQKIHESLAGYGNNLAD
jgi:hypothetical protein